MVDGVAGANVSVVPLPRLESVTQTFLECEVLCLFHLSYCMLDLHFDE